MNTHYFDSGVSEAEAERVRDIEPIPAVCRAAACVVLSSVTLPEQTGGGGDHENEHKSSKRRLFGVVIEGKERVPSPKKVQVAAVARATGWLCSACRSTSSFRIRSVATPKTLRHASKTLKTTTKTIKQPQHTRSKSKSKSSRNRITETVSNAP